MGINNIIDDAYGILKDTAESVNAEFGFANDTHYEPSNVFPYNKTNAESIIQGQNNTCIVFGKDRLGSETHGYGGQGHAKCGAIDICVGRLSNLDATTLSGPVNSNTGADAARIYLSQKADIDDYFNLASGVVDKDHCIGRSAIAIKADDVRVVARNTLKLVTNSDNNLSVGVPSMIGTGVQLIANNDDSNMQPMVKGQNLVDSLKKLSELVDNINSTLQKFIKLQLQYNSKIALHTHRTIVNGIPTLFSEQCNTPGIKNVTNLTLELEPECVAHSSNLNSWRNTYIEGGNSHIASSYHFLN